MTTAYWSRIQRTIDYIEERLDQPLTLAELARHAGFSEYHFHRVFAMMAGDSVMEYVRKRRLARAAYALSHTAARVVDVAFDCGFASHETFTRAFRRMFGMSPNAYRRRGIAVPPYEKLNVLQGKYHPYLGGIAMQYRIEKKPAFRVIGYALRTSHVDGRNHREIPAFWQQYLANRWWETIPVASRGEEAFELGICHDFDMQTGEFTYLIGMECHPGQPEEPLAEPLVSSSFPEATYAVFTTPAVPHAEFSFSIQATWKAIFEEWFPHSGYEHAGGAEFELYDRRSNAQKNELVQMDIYISVKPQGQ